MRRVKAVLKCCVVAAAAVLTTAGAWAGGGAFDLTWHRIAGGGETFSTGGNFSLGGTIGQHEAGDMSGGSFTLNGGFWPAAADADPGDPKTPPCPADLTGSGSVGVADLLELLACWGPVQPGCESADLTDSGTVGVADLLDLLAQWGPCPE